MHEKSLVTNYLPVQKLEKSIKLMKKGYRTYKLAHLTWFVLLHYLIKS